MADPDEGGTVVGMTSWKELIGEHRYQDEVLAD